MKIETLQKAIELNEKIEQCEKALVLFEKDGQSRNPRLMVGFDKSEDERAFKVIAFGCLEDLTQSTKEAIERKKEAFEAEFSAL